MATNKVWHGLSPMIDLGILLYNIMLYSWQPTNIFTVHTSPLHSFTMMFEWEQPLIIVGFSMASGASSSIIGQTLRHHQHRYGRNVQTGRHSLGREGFRVMSYGSSVCCLKRGGLLKENNDFDHIQRGLFFFFVFLVHLRSLNNRKISGSETSLISQGAKTSPTWSTHRGAQDPTASMGRFTMARPRSVLPEAFGTAKRLTGQRQLGHRDL